MKHFYFSDRILRSLTHFELENIAIERCFVYAELESENGYKNLEKEAKIFEVLNKKKLKIGRKMIKEAKNSIVIANPGIDKNCNNNSIVFSHM